MPLRAFGYEAQQTNTDVCMGIHPDDIVRRGGWAGVGAGTRGGTGVVRVRVRIRTGTDRPDFGTVDAYKRTRRTRENILEPSLRVLCKSRTPL